MLLKVGPTKRMMLQLHESGIRDSYTVSKVIIIEMSSKLAANYWSLLVIIESPGSVRSDFRNAS